jgi:cytochrome c
MRTLVILAFGAVFAAFMSQTALAEERGTFAEAKAMAVKAAAYLRENGADKSLAAFGDKAGPFIDRDLYVFVVDDNWVVRAHPISPALVGKNLADLKDVDGKPLVKEMVAVQDTGEIEYKWLDPKTKLVAPKVAYVIKVDEFRVIVGAYQ